MCINTSNRNVNNSFFKRSIAKVNNRKNLPICMDNKNITNPNLTFTERVIFIRPVNTEGYKKVNFAIKTCEFYNREQPELNQLPYSQPVEKITLPYKNHEETTLTQECQEHCLLLHAPPILNDSTTIKNDSFINKKKDNSLMPVHKTSMPEVKFINNFRLNRSANKFSNFIFEIKSIQEKSTRYLKNKLKKNNNEELYVKFESEKANITDEATIVRKNLMKQHEKINHAKAMSDIIYTTQQEKSDLYNNYRILLNEISSVEPKANELIIKDQNAKNENNKIFQYHNQFKQLNIIDILDFTKSPDEKYKKINNIFNQMKTAIRQLEDYIDESTINKQLTWDDNDLNWNNPLNQSENTQIEAFVKPSYSQETMNDAISIINKSDSDIISEDAKTILNKFFNDDHQSSNINFHLSNESINSTSSGYYSDEKSTLNNTKKSLIPKPIKNFDNSIIQKSNIDIKNSLTSQSVNKKTPNTNIKNQSTRYSRKNNSNLIETGVIKKNERIKYENNDVVNRLHKGEKINVILPGYLSDSRNETLIKETISSKLRKNHNTQSHEKITIEEAHSAKINKQLASLNAK